MCLVDDSTFLHFDFRIPFSNVSGVLFEDVWGVGWNVFIDRGARMVFGPFFCLDKTEKRHCRILFLIEDSTTTRCSMGSFWRLGSILYRLPILFASTNSWQLIWQRTARGAQLWMFLRELPFCNSFMRNSQENTSANMCKYRQPCRGEVQLSSAIAFLCFSCHCSMRQHVELSLSFGFSSAALDIVTQHQTSTITDGWYGLALWAPACYISQARFLCGGKQHEELKKAIVPFCMWSCHGRQMDEIAQQKCEKERENESRKVTEQWYIVHIYNIDRWCAYITYFLYDMIYYTQWFKHDTVTSLSNHRERGCISDALVHIGETRELTLGGPCFWDWADWGLSLWASCWGIPTMASFRLSIKITVAHEKVPCFLLFGLSVFWRFVAWHGVLTSVAFRSSILAVNCVRFSLVPISVEAWFQLSQSTAISVSRSSSASVHGLQSYQF